MMTGSFLCRRYPGAVTLRGGWRCQGFAKLNLAIVQLLRGIAMVSTDVESRPPAEPDAGPMLADPVQSLYRRRDLEASG